MKLKGRPKIPDTDKKVNISAKVSPKVRDYLSEQENQSRFLESLILSWMDYEKEQQKDNKSTRR